jgi:hypothetical protein
VNGVGERRAELEVVVGLEERELLLVNATDGSASVRVRVPRPRSLPSGLVRID